MILLTVKLKASNSENEIYRYIVFLTCCVEMTKFFTREVIFKEDSGRIVMQGIGIELSFCPFCGDKIQIIPSPVMPQSGRYDYKKMVSAEELEELRRLIM